MEKNISPLSGQSYLWPVEACDKDESCEFVSLKVPVGTNTFATWTALVGKTPWAHQQRRLATGLGLRGAGASMPTQGARLRIYSEVRSHCDAPRKVSMVWDSLLWKEACRRSLLCTRTYQYVRHFREQTNEQTRAHCSSSSLPKINPWHLQLTVLRWKVMGKALLLVVFVSRQVLGIDFI